MNGVLGPPASRRITVPLEPAVDDIVFTRVAEKKPIP